MIVTIPTGSKMDRIVRCPASAALPQIFDIEEDKGRDRGTAMHKYLERVAQVGRDLALAEVDEEFRGFCADIEIAKLADRLTLSTEFAVAYNWRTDTARKLEPVDHRAYEVDETCEIPLTLDLAGAADGWVYAGDFKSGHGWLPAPHQSMQLGLGALALARLHGATNARIEYIRILDDGRPLRFDAELDIFGLDAAADRVVEAMRDVEVLKGQIADGLVPTVIEGPHCRYCPARQFCPAKTALIRAVLSDPKPISYEFPLTPEGASQAYALLKRAKDALKQVEGAIHAYAKTTPIPIGVDEDGSLRFFGELRRPGNEVFDGGVAHQVLSQLYGGEAANKAVTMEVTKKAITDVARAALMPGEKISKVVDDIFDAIRARHGASRPITNKPTEFTISPENETKARKRKTA